MPTHLIAFLLIICFSPAVFSGTEVAFSLLSLDQATKMIVEELKNKVLGAKTESIDGKIVHIIKILTDDGRIQYLKVDADNGTIIK